MPQRAFLTALAAVATLVSFARTVPAAVSLSPIGTYATGVPFDGDNGAAEIPAGKAPSVDLEPEYVTVAKHGKMAWVTLQEANAVAEIDHESTAVTGLRGLGFKSHGAGGNATVYELTGFPF